MKLKLTTLFLIGMTMSLFMGESMNPLQAQEKEGVEIIDENGQRVQIEEQAEARPKAQAGARSVEMKAGKITIVNEDGTVTEMGVPAAGGVTVNRSVQTVVENGKKKTVVSGKAVFIGPNGERQEIQLGEDGGEGVLGVLQGKIDMPGIFEFHKNPAELRMTPNQSTKFMIGVHCNPTSEALRSHLELADGTGLTVTTVVAGSPSDKAGVKKHDILMYAGDKQLTSINLLNKEIETAGEAGETVSMTLIRSGKEMSLEVTPTEREVLQGAIGRPDFDLPVPGIPKLDFEMREFGPGIIIGGDGFGKSGLMDGKFEELQKRMDLRMQEQMKRMKEMNEKIERQTKDLLRKIEDAGRPLKIN